jgi:hypothetical protein
MEIKEVPIMPKPTRRDKFSEDVLQKTRSYLSVRGFNVEEMTDKQFEYVAKHIKGKYFAKIAILINIFVIGFSVFAAIGSYISIKKVANSLEVMIPPHTVVINADNSRKVIDADPKIVEYFGKANILIGTSISLWGFVIAYDIAKIVGFMVKIRMKDPAIEAFLPVKQHSFIVNE